ncbi:MAG: hypothetical protein ACD_2C00064G0002 [uncultured bacterium (gcode 4)]|uniref:Uncharacterized protein n=1 Tax=uncultured bacterium (gcode 4) TaxID=1234023 RepID=K2H2A9_9BACT|nr:MAG: hypothetical protein ACD_2C00064G0002 [uncultured bacterium (gcode 4)]
MNIHTFGCPKYAKSIGGTEMLSSFASQIKWFRGRFLIPQTPSSDWKSLFHYATHLRFAPAR